MHGAVNSPNAGILSRMKAMLETIRSYLGFGGNSFPDIVTNKRDRANEEEEYSDDEFPTHKRLKVLSNTKFPRLMSDQDEWDRPNKSSNVRIVPIHLENYPSTSTPYDRRALSSERSRALPASRMVGATEIRPVHRPRAHTPREVVHTIVDDDPKISWIEPKANSFSKNNSRDNSEMYVLVDDDEDEQDENDGEIVYVERVPQKKKLFYSRDRSPSLDRDSPRRPVRLHRKVLERRDQSPRTKFKSPAGITKVYRQKPFLAKFLCPIRSSTLSQLPLHNRFSQMNGNARTAIKEAFNLEEKQSYRDLIQQMSERAKPALISKPIEVINLADDYTTRAPQLGHKHERLDTSAQRVTSITDDKDKDYEPITIANSSDSEVEIVPNSSNASTSSSVRIQPINSLRSLNKVCPATKPHFASSIVGEFDKKWQDKTAETGDVAGTAKYIGDIGKEQTMVLLRRTLKQHLRLTEDDDDVLAEEPAAEIPQLTVEQDKLVDRALAPGPAGQVFVDKFGLRIHRRDLQTLAGLNWLNDEVINFYMNLIMQRCEERKNLPRTYAANTFFYPKLMQSGQAGLRRWTRKVDIFAHDLMVIPVHLDVHWCMCLVELDKKRVLYLDSMGGPNQRCLDAVLQYLRDEHQDKKGEPFDDKGWRKEQLKDIPQQMNGSDCGMFACTFAEFASRRARFTFTQADMPRLRRKVVFEILQGKLMQ